MNQECLIIGTLTHQVNTFAEKDTLPDFFRTLAAAMTVNNPKSLIEAYNLIDDVCLQISEAAEPKPAASSGIIDADALQATEGKHPASCIISPVIIAEEAYA